jgi:argininosuccinate synthase
MKKRIALAYSGGLDTTVIIPWLKENYDCEVVAICVDVGQGMDVKLLKERSIASGASKIIFEDVRERFVSEYVWPMVKSGAVYEGKYLLGTSIARPLIAKVLVEDALKEKCTAICHGCTGKGNDQVRFEMAVKAFAPEMEIIAPWRIWNIQSREEEIEYLKARNIPAPFNADQSYSRDENVWHLSHEGLELEDPANEPNYGHLLQLGVSPEKAPEEGVYVTLDFEQGQPVALNGKTMKPFQLLTALNEIGGKHGIGIIDIVENRVVGMKSRGVYETPGGAIIMAAHENLERLCLDRQTYAFKSGIAEKMAELIYGGLWFTPLRESLSAFVDKSQETVTGRVKLFLYKGNIRPAGTTSPYSLYNTSIASFTTGALYDHADAEGFINLYGLSVKVRAMNFKALKDSKKLRLPGAKKAAAPKAAPKAEPAKAAPKAAAAPVAPAPAAPAPVTAPAPKAKASAPKASKPKTPAPKAPKSSK